MNNKPSLSTILLKDVQNAKQPTGGTFEVLPADTYTAKILNWVEEDSYSYISVEINKKKYNFFYNYYNYNTQDLNADLITWIKALATIPLEETTPLLDVTNSSIGNSYQIKIYNYQSKTGKNAGKLQHAISFKDLPIHVATPVDVVDADDLPF